MQILSDLRLDLKNAKQCSSSLLELPQLHHPPTTSLAINSLQSKQIWVTNMYTCLLCVVKIKVTCWQLRDNQRNDEWPCLLVKVDRRSYSMNRSLSSECSLISEVWVETDSPNYRSSSNERPWEAAETAIPVHKCTYIHTQRIFSQWKSQFSPRCLFPLLPSALMTATYRILSHCKLSSEATDTTYRNTYLLYTSINAPLQYTLIHNAYAHIQGHLFRKGEKIHQPYSISCCLNTLVLIIFYWYTRSVDNLHKCSINSMQANWWVSDDCSSPISIYISNLLT